MPAKVLIVGAGAIGAFYGARLSLAPSCLVSALCRSNYKTVEANGFSVTSSQYETQTFKPAQTFANADEARKSNTHWDYLLVSTKALPDVSDDSTLLEGLVGPKTAIVLVQNGLGVEEPYAKRFPHATVLSAVTIASVAQPRAGHIQHNRWTRISVGPYLTDSGKSSNATATARNTEFVQLLQKGGIKDAEDYDHAGLQFVRWHKIAINAAMNPTAVLSGGTPNATMANDPDLAAFLLGVMNEVLETAPKVLGQPLPKKLASAEQILKSTRKNDSGSKPSMLLDWEQGKRMELEVILGNPVRIARDKGLEMPRLQALYALLRKAQENRENGQGWVKSESKL
jgi:2-dehydropantoate 2-reductase